MKGLLLAVQVEGIMTRKDNTLKVTLGTQELSSGNAGELFSLQNKIATVYISAHSIDQKEIEQVDKIDPEFQGKTQSQRIRSVLYLVFQNNSEGFKDFDSYYKNKTEKYIEHLKSKIES